MVEISAEIIPPGVYVISAVEAHPNHNNQFNYSPPQYDADYAQVITLEPSGRLSVIQESPIRSPMIQIGNVQKLSDVRIMPKEIRKPKLFKFISNLDQFLFKYKFFQLFAWSILITAKKN